MRGVYGVDEAARQITFSAGGMDPKQDPYFVHYYRINFDGTGLTRADRRGRHHTVTLLAGRQVLRRHVVARRSARRSRSSGAPSDGKVVLELERGDVAPLAAAGWRAPEVVHRQGPRRHDGHLGHHHPADATSIRRRSIRSSRTSTPGRTAHSCRRRSASYYGMQALAELGFIVVQIDGMGTANRSKAFHDVAWKNLGDAGFPDRILWHQAVAKKYPCYDITPRRHLRRTRPADRTPSAAALPPRVLQGRGRRLPAATTTAWTRSGGTNSGWAGRSARSTPTRPTSSHAGNLQGKLLLVVGELDTNVDPSSTMQVVNALIKANKTLRPAGDARRGSSGRTPRPERAVRRSQAVGFLRREPARLADAVVERAGDVEDAGPTARVYGDDGLGVWGQSWERVARAWGNISVRNTLIQAIVLRVLSAHSPSSASKAQSCERILHTIPDGPVTRPPTASSRLVTCGEAR